MHVGVIVPDGPSDRVALVDVEVENRDVAPEVSRCGPIFPALSGPLATAGGARKPLSFPCYFGRLRLEGGRVSWPPHPWRLAGDVQRAAIAAFNFLKNKD